MEHVRGKMLKPWGSRRIRCVSTAFWTTNTFQISFESLNRQACKDTVISTILKYTDIISRKRFPRKRKNITYIDISCLYIFSSLWKRVICSRDSRADLHINKRLYLWIKSGQVKSINRLNTNKKLICNLRVIPVIHNSIVIWASDC